METTSEKLIKKMEDYKYEMLDHALWVNESKSNGQKLIALSSYENLLDNFIRCMQDSEKEITTLNDKNEMLTQRIDDLLVELSRHKKM